MAEIETPERSYVLISPCRDEADYMRRTLESVVAQTVTPAKWVIVDDGSTDATPEILAEYAAQHGWIEVIQKPDRGARAVGPGVIEAFYAGLSQVDLDACNYLCKLDLDLDLPPRYFETLMARMEADPRVGTASGKPYVRRNGTLVSERRGDEMSVGMTKFYRVACFREIGGLVREVMWDAIDCHKARMLGWRAVSWDDPELRFEHLRPMGSSQSSIYTGRKRHGFGQYYMGSDPFYYAATCVFRMAEPPYVLGGLAMMQGYLSAWMNGADQHEDEALKRFIRRWQRRALLKGKSRATRELETRATSGLKQRSPQTSEQGPI